MFDRKLPVACRVTLALAAALLAGAALSSIALAQGITRTAAPGDAVAIPSPSTATASSSAPQSEAIPTKSLLRVLRDGGPLMIPIAFCSFVLFVFLFERCISLRRGRVIPGPFVRRFIEQLRAGQLNQESALKLCRENKSPVAEVFAGAVRKWGRPSVEVEQAVIDAGERASNSLRRYIRLFNGVATVSPLLGLLGTVLGMISAFNAIATADAMGKPELLAVGISQALLTTAAGLLVAIPALIAYLYFVSRVDKLLIEIDRLAERVVGLIASDGWDEESQKPEKSSRRNKAA